MDPSKLTPEEAEIILLAADVANLHGRLPEVHPDHHRDVADAVHLIQRIVMSRVARRCNPDVFSFRSGRSDLLA